MFPGKESFFVRKFKLELMPRLSQLAQNAPQKFSGCQCFPNDSMYILLPLNPTYFHSYLLIRVALME